MQRIVIAAHKGGAGKTTVTVNLAAALAALGRRVLVVDVDPQGTVAAALGVEPDKPGLYEALSGQVGIREAIVATSYAGLGVLPSDLDLAGAEVELPRRAGWQDALSQLLAPLDGVCELALVDTPPGLGVLSFTALRAATAAIAVCPLDYLAFRSLPHLEETLARAGVPLLGIVPNLTGSGTRHAREVSEELTAKYGGQLLPGIPQRVALKDAALAGQPINVYEPASAASVAFAELALEVMNRGSYQSSGSPAEPSTAGT